MAAPDRCHSERIGTVPSGARRSRARALGSLVLALAACRALAQEPAVCPAPGDLPADAAAILAPQDPDAPIEVTSDDAALSASGDASLKGNVEVRQGSREIRAENVQYDASANAFRVEGRVEYRDPLVSVRGGGGTYSATRGARFREAEFELPARPARGTAGQIELAPDGRIRLEEVTYTTCPVNDDAWQLRAAGITLDTRTRNGTGRGAAVDFQGVPILYLPWISFPLGSERKSGFLFPSAGFSSRSGAQLAVPYYWNIAPNYDLSFEPVYYSKRGLNAAGEFRFLTRRHRGSFAFDFLPDDWVYDDDRSRVRLQVRSDLPRGWRLTLAAENVSDPEYFEDFGQGAAGTSVAFVERLATLAYAGEHWRLRGEVQQFQTLDRLLPQDERPYAQLPRLLASGTWTAGARAQLRYGFDSELVNFYRELGVSGWRLNAEPHIGLALEGPGWFLRPSARVTSISYSLDDPAPGAPSSPARTIPQASVDAGLVFERPAGSNGSGLWTLEPRLLYHYAPFREQSDLPLFDTTPPDLNLVQLFRTNRYVGGDRVGDANEVSLGVTTRLIDAADGTQFLAATLGQTYYFETPQVQIPGETVRSRNRSDLVAQLALVAYRDWNVDLGIQWNPDEHRSERSQLQLQYRPADDRVVNLGYRQQAGRLEQAEISAAWPFARRWNGFARAVYSLRDDQAIEQFAGFEYRACCWRLRLVGRRSVSNRTGELDTGVYLQLELTGLASVGTPADAFLEQSIRGYSPAQTSP